MQQEDKEVEIRKIVQDTMEAERKIQRNRILYNTRILMEQYIEMRRHVENAISEVEEMDATEFESLMQENTHLESVRRTKLKTAMMIANIELPAEIQTLPEATMKQIHELIEYEERISQIADMTGADPDLIKSRIEEYAKMKEKTPLEAANEVKAALHLRDAYVEAAKAANEMMQDLARRLGEAFDQLGDIVKDIAEDLERIMQQVRETLMTSEKRRAEIRAWRRYYEARAKASNNYRRMHGLPMVRRPRRRYGRRSKPPDGSGRGTEERNYTNGE